MSIPYVSRAEDAVSKHEYSQKNPVPSNLLKELFYVNTRTPPAVSEVSEKRPVISLVTWFGGSLSFQLRPLKSSLGKVRKVAVTVRRKETSLSWIFSQMIMMLCEFAWTFCLLVFSITGSTGRDLFLSVLLFLSIFLIDSLSIKLTTSTWTQRALMISFYDWNSF